MKKYLGIFLAFFMILIAGYVSKAVIASDKEDMVQFGIHTIYGDECLVENVAIDFYIEAGDVESWQGRYVVNGTTDCDEHVKKLMEDDQKEHELISDFYYSKGHAYIEKIEKLEGNKNGYNYNYSLFSYGDSIYMFDYYPQDQKYCCGVYEVSSDGNTLLDTYDALYSFETDSIYCVYARDQYLYISYWNNSKEKTMGVFPEEFINAEADYYTEKGYASLLANHYASYEDWAFIDVIDMETWEVKGTFPMNLKTMYFHKIRTTNYYYYGCCEHLMAQYQDGYLYLLDFCGILEGTLTENCLRVISEDGCLYKGELQFPLQILDWDADGINWSYCDIQVLE